jgi:hypothetical protein
LGPICIGSATWAAPSSRLWVRDAWIGLALAVELKASECGQGRSVGTGEIAKVANADETSGQDMLAKAAQELGSGESHDPLLIAVSIVFPSESDLMTIEAKQTVIADGHAMCVTTKVAKYAIRLPKSRLGIDYPVLE